MKSDGMTLEALLAAAAPDQDAGLELLLLVRKKPDSEGPRWHATARLMPVMFGEPKLQSYHGQSYAGADVALYLALSALVETLPNLPRPSQGDEQ